MSKVEEYGKKDVMNTKRNLTKQTPQPAFRVFISSTYIDMIPYREAIQTALNKADCLAYGMERFGAQAILTCPR